MENLRELIKEECQLKNGNLELKLNIADLDKGKNDELMQKYRLTVATSKYNDSETISTKIVEFLENYFKNIDKSKKVINIPSERKIICHPDGEIFEIFSNKKVEVSDKNEKISEEINNLSAKYNEKDIEEKIKSYLNSYQQLKEQMVEVESIQETSDKYYKVSEKYQFSDVLMTCGFEFGYDTENEEDIKMAIKDGYCEGYYKTTITFPAYFFKEEQSSEIKTIWDIENNELYILLVTELCWIGYADGKITRDVVELNKNK